MINCVIWSVYSSSSSDGLVFKWTSHIAIWFLFMGFAICANIYFTLKLYLPLSIICITVIWNTLWYIYILCLFFFIMYNSKNKLSSIQNLNYIILITQMYIIYNLSNIFSNMFSITELDNMTIQSIRIILKIGFIFPASSQHELKIHPVYFLKAYYWSYWEWIHQCVSLFINCFQTLPMKQQQTKEVVGYDIFLTFWGIYCGTNRRCF